MATIGKMRLLPILLCYAPLTSASGTFTRDWVKYPPIVERPAASVLFAIGDIHGDYERALRVMIAARIVADVPAEPEAAVWNAGSATLVITGDMIDKGPRPVDVLRFLIALRRDAPRHGGEVILLAGNHETEFLATPTQKKAEDTVADFRRAGVSATDVAACKGELGEFFCSLPWGARVGDWFFCHGGSTSGLSVAELTEGIEKGVEREGFAAKELLAPTSLLEARMTDGLQWFDAPDRKITERELLTRNASALGAKHIVQGHQPKAVKFSDGVERGPGQMFQRWGLLFMIDTGLSRGVDNSHGAVLRVTDGQAVAICPNGAETLLWSAEAKQDTGRALACQ